MFRERPAELTNEAVFAWLERHAREGKFFFWAHYFDPHAAYLPPEPYRSRYADDLYTGEIAYTDRQIGKLLAKLKDARRAGPDAGGGDLRPRRGPRRARRDDPRPARLRRHAPRADDLQRAAALSPGRGGPLTGVPDRRHAQHPRAGGGRGPRWPRRPQPARARRRHAAPDLHREPLHPGAARLGAAAGRAAGRLQVHLRPDAGALRPARRSPGARQPLRAGAGALRRHARPAALVRRRRSLHGNRRPAEPAARPRDRGAAALPRLCLQRPRPAARPARLLRPRPQGNGLPLGQGRAGRPAEHARGGGFGHREPGAGPGRGSRRRLRQADPLERLPDLRRVREGLRDDPQRRGATAGRRRHRGRRGLGSARAEPGRGGGGEVPAGPRARAPLRHGAPGAGPDRPAAAPRARSARAAARGDRDRPRQQRPGGLPRHRPPPPRQAGARRGPQAFRQALEIDAMYGPGYDGLAQVLLEEGKPDEARPLLATALRYHPAQPQTLSTLAQILRDRGARPGDPAVRARPRDQPQVRGRLQQPGAHLPQAGRRGEGRRDVRPGDRVRPAASTPLT